MLYRILSAFSLSWRLSIMASNSLDALFYERKRKKGDRGIERSKIRTSTLKKTDRNSAVLGKSTLLPFVLANLHLIKLLSDELMSCAVSNIPSCWIRNQLFFFSLVLIQDPISALTHCQDSHKDEEPKPPHLKLQHQVHPLFPKWVDVIKDQSNDYINTIGFVSGNAILVGKRDDEFMRPVLT